MEWLAVGSKASLASVMVLSVLGGVCAAIAKFRKSCLPQGRAIDWSGQVFGHRGCRFIKDVPENTLEAFAFAKKHGAVGIELDLVMCKSGELLVFHDPMPGPMLEEGTDSSQGGRDPKLPSRMGEKIKNLTLQEIRTMRYVDDSSKSITVPTLDEAIDFCAQNDLKLLLEIKEFDRRRFRTLAKAMAESFRRNAHKFPASKDDPCDNTLYDNTIVISFNPFVLYLVRELDPRIAVGVLCDGELVSYSLQMKRTVPKLLTVAPKVSDFLIDVGLTYVAPKWAGASMFGTHFKFYNEGTRKELADNNMMYYLWGFKDPEDCTEAMRKGKGVTVAVDDSYLHYRRKDE